MTGQSRNKEAENARMLSDLARRNTGPSRSPSPARRGPEPAGSPGKGKGKSKKGKQGKGLARRSKGKGKGDTGGKSSWMPTPPTREVFLGDGRQDRAAPPP